MFKKEENNPEETKNYNILKKIFLFFWLHLAPCGILVP